MFIWEKKGLVYNPTLEENRPSWRWDFAQGQNALIFDEFVRVYICCREKPNVQGQTKSRLTYVDLDRADLSKVIRIASHSVLELGILGAFDEFGQYPFSVVRWGNLLYGYHGGVTRCESVPFNVAIGIAVSEDEGEIFHKIGHGPILSYTLHEPFCIGSPKVRIFEKKFYMTYSAGVKWVNTVGRPEICYKLKMAVSDDGIRWHKLNKRLLIDKLGEDESQACGDILFKAGKYHMFYCYRRNLDFRKNKENSYRIGYAWSTDLQTWHRDDDKAGIDISADEAAWDSEMVAYPNVFELDGKIYMLYLGNEVGKYGFGLAELKGDLV